jgi:cytochrome c
MLRTLATLAGLMLMLLVFTSSRHIGHASGASEPSISETSQLAELLSLEGDAEYGAYLASECSTCHQRSGHADGIPSLGELSRLEFLERMYAYRTGELDNVTMRDIATRLSFEELAALAAHFDNSQTK